MFFVYVYVHCSVMPQHPDLHHAEPVIVVVTPRLKALLIVCFVISELHKVPLERHHVLLVFLVYSRRDLCNEITNTICYCDMNNDIRKISNTLCCFVTGTFQSSTGQQNCQPCPLGTFSNTTSLVSCYPCELGTYMPGTGATSCGMRLWSRV